MLGNFFESFRPAEVLSTPGGHLVWLQIRNVPLGTRNESIFSVVACLFGEFLSLDKDTLDMKRFDRARGLICATSPRVIRRTVDILIEGKAVAVVVVPELATCPWGVPREDLDAMNNPKSPPSFPGVSFGGQFVGIRGGGSGYRYRFRPRYDGRRLR